MTKQDKIMIAAGGFRIEKKTKLSKLFMESITEHGIDALHGKGIRFTVDKTKDANFVRCTMFIVDEDGNPLHTFMDQEIHYGDMVTMFKLDQAFTIQISS